MWLISILLMIISLVWSDYLLVFIWKLKCRTFQDVIIFHIISLFTFDTWYWSPHPHYLYSYHHLKIINLLRLTPHHFVSFDNLSNTYIILVLWFFLKKIGIIIVVLIYDKLHTCPNTCSRFRQTTLYTKI